MQTSWYVFSNYVINHMIERVIVMEHLSTALFDVFVDRWGLFIARSVCFSLERARGPRSVNCAIVCAVQTHASREGNEWSSKYRWKVLVVCIQSILRPRSLETPLSFYNSRTEHDMETKLTSIDFSRRGAEGFRSHGCKFSVTKLSIVPHTLGILTANVTCCINLLWIINQSQVNLRVV